MRSDVLDLFFLIIVEVIEIIIVIEVIVIVDVDLVDLDVFFVEVVLIIDVVDIVLVVDIVEVVLFFIIIIHVVVEHLFLFLVAGMAVEDRREGLAERGLGKFALDRKLSDRGQGNTFPHRSVLKDWGSNRESPDGLDVAEKAHPLASFDAVPEGGALLVGKRYEVVKRRPGRNPPDCRKGPENGPDSRETDELTDRCGSDDRLQDPNRFDCL